MTLGDVARLDYGFTASALEEGHLRLVRITDIADNGKIRPDAERFVEATDESKRYRLREGDLLVARTGASYGKTALVDLVDPAVFASFLIRVSVDRQQLLPAFYWHFAQSRSYWTQARSLVSVGGQPQFNGNVLTKVQLPVPPLEKQTEVVGVLDAFDALVNDLSVGLPAELKARRSQYEYYRDRLLTFEEAA
jgi:type I restriction enzyme S subunit